jgi:hypothetical protein
LHGDDAVGGTRQSLVADRERRVAVMRRGKHRALQSIDGHTGRGAERVFRIYR